MRPRDAATALIPLALLGCGMTTITFTEPPSATPAATHAPTATSPDDGGTPTGAAPTATALPGAFGELVQSDLARDTDPDVPAEDLSALVGGDTAFALDLYQQIRAAPGNLFYSPHSISVALAMTWAGARGDTAAQMASALNFTLAPEALHPAFNRLALELDSRAAPGGGALPFTLDVVNATWGQEGYAFLDPFLDTLAVSYGAGLRLVDYRGDTEGARQTINAWVDHETRGKIDDLLPPGVLTVDTRLVLVNAIFFSASWKFPFEEARTADAPFTLLDGSAITAPTMRATFDGGGVQLARGEGYTALELPYDGDQLSMVIVQPEAGAFEAFEAGLDGARLTQILSDLRSAHVDVSLPRFAFEHELPLAKTLEAMGMTDAFDPVRADLSGMDGTRDLFVQDVLHQAYVSVDEAGTEAAAATAVVVGIESEPQHLSIDSPFVFFIRDQPTGALLFMGRVVDPSAG